MPIFCPACGSRVHREREPEPDSPMIARWRNVAEQLAPKRPPEQR